MAAIGLAAHQVFAAVIERADVSTFTPFEYTALVWVTLTGYVIHRESLRPRAQACTERPPESRRCCITIEKTENETDRFD